MVSPFGLAVGLRVVGHHQHVGDAEFVVEGIHQLCCELGAAIQDDFSGNAMESKNLLVVNIRDPFGINLRGSGDDVYLFTIVVDVHSDCVIPSNWGQSSDQIHTNRLPWAIRSLLRFS